MASIGELTSSFTQNFSVSEGLTLLQPLALFIIGIAVYSLFIFKFYKFLARREIFDLNFVKQGTGAFKTVFGSILYVIKYAILFPIFTFFWFLVLSIILAFLAKTSSVETILLISVALVGTIRIMAYYNEDLSKDLAKMMPFALLGVFIVDISFFSLADSYSVITQFPEMWRIMVYYLLILIAIEFILRIIHLILSPLIPESKNKEEKD